MSTQIRIFMALLMLTGCSGPTPDDSNQSAFERAGNAAERGDFEGALQLYGRAGREEADHEKRDEAELRMANLEWRVFGKTAEARSRLQKLAARSAMPMDAWLELARVEAQSKRWEAARAFATRAVDASKTKRERWRARSALAYCVLEDPQRPTREEAAREVVALRQLIAEQGPTLNTSRLLTGAAILATDDAALMDGVNGYYHVSPSNGPPAGIAAGYRDLEAALASGSQSGVVSGLVGIRFFREAATLARMTGDRSGAASDAIAYSDALERIKRLTETYYRDIALRRDDDDDLRDGVERELRLLWPALRWPGAAPQFTMDAAAEELGRRFGTYINIGKTGGNIDAHIAHRVTDSRLRAEQYGRSAEVRFISLDAVVSNGYSEWANDGRSGDGGWGTATEIHQVRPRYADGPLRKWQSVADEEIRAERDKRMAERAAEDRRKGAIATFSGTSLRLERLYLDSVMAEVQGRHSEPAAIRDAFLARVERDEFQHSVLLHEGRHAIDAGSGEKLRAADLEFRAKLSAIALSDAPQLALSAVLGESVGDGSPHGTANERLFKNLTAWMETHRRAIPALDATLPLLSQADKLTGDQIRSAARSFDPMANQPGGR